MRLADMGMNGMPHTESCIRAACVFVVLALAAVWSLPSQVAQAEGFTFSDDTDTKPLAAGMLGDPPAPSLVSMPVASLVAQITLGSFLLAAAVLKILSARYGPHVSRKTLPDDSSSPSKGNS
jgi:hypothetical protein